METPPNTPAETRDTRNNWKVVIVCVIGIVIIECVALYKGINGTLLSSTTALIGGIAGRYLGVATTLRKIIPLLLVVLLVSCASHTTVWRSEAADGTLDTVTIKGVALPGGKGEQQADASIIVDASGAWTVKLGSAAKVEAEVPGITPEAAQGLLKLLLAPRP